MKGIRKLVCGKIFLNASPVKYLIMELEIIEG